MQRYERLLGRVKDATETEDGLLVHMRAARTHLGDLMTCPPPLALPSYPHLYPRPVAAML